MELIWLPKRLGKSGQPQLLEVGPSICRCFLQNVFLIHSVFFYFVGVFLCFCSYTGWTVRSDILDYVEMSLGRGGDNS